jgi:hypothetical protein
VDDENLQKEARKRAQEEELENQEELFRCMGSMVVRLSDQDVGCLLRCSDGRQNQGQNLQRRSNEPGHS